MNLNDGFIVFLARANDDGTRLEFAAEQRLMRQTFLRAHKGQEVDVIITPRGALKIRLQEAGFHAMISRWAKAEGLEIDDLKRDLLLAIFGTREHVNRLTGEVEVVLREPHTSKLTRTNYSLLIERTLEIAARCGHVLEAPTEYKERKRREAQRKGRAA